MSIVKYFAAAIIAAMAVPAMAGETVDEPIFSGDLGAAGPDAGPVEEAVAVKRLRRPETLAQAETPSAAQIQRKLEAPVRKALKRSERVTIREFKRRPELRRAAPSIDIQSINIWLG